MYITHTYIFFIYNIYELYTLPAANRKAKGVYSMYCFLSFPNMLVINLQAATAAAAAE